MNFLHISINGKEAYEVQDYKKQCLVCLQRTQQLNHYIVTIISTSTTLCRQDGLSLRVNVEIDMTGEFNNISDTRQIS